MARRKHMITQTQIEVARRRRHLGIVDDGMQSLSKAQAQRLHSVRAGAARYGLGLVEIAEVKAAIREGRSIPIRKQSNRITIHDVELGGRTVRAVYDRRRHEVVTFIPRGKQ